MSKFFSLHLSGKDNIFKNVLVSVYYTFIYTSQVGPTHANWIGKCVFRLS